MSPRPTRAIGSVQAPAAAPTSRSTETAIDSRSPSPRSSRATSPWPRAGQVGAIVALLAALGGCHDQAADDARALAHGDPDQGRLRARYFGCGTCHDIPGVGGAHGHVGPALADLGSRMYLAGRVPNTPEQLEQWIRFPQQIAPGSTMPDMGIDERDARDIATYLYTLR